MTLPGSTLAQVPHFSNTHLHDKFCWVGFIKCFEILEIHFQLPNTQWNDLDYVAILLWMRRVDEVRIQYPYSSVKQVSEPKNDQLQGFI